jgi:hypothetical protein
VFGRFFLVNSRISEGNNNNTCVLSVVFIINFPCTSRHHYLVPQIDGCLWRIAGANELDLCDGRWFVYWAHCTVLKKAKGFLSVVVYHFGIVSLYIDKV